MKLNASKCKEMLMCFLRKRPEIQPLCVNGKVLETVKSRKVLGLIIQDNLTEMEQAHRNVHQQSVETSPHHPNSTARGRSTTGPTPSLLRSSSLCPRILLRYLALQSAKIPIEEYRNGPEKGFTYYPTGNIA